MARWAEQSADDPAGSLREEAIRILGRDPQMDDVPLLVSATRAGPAGPGRRDRLHGLRAQALATLALIRPALATGHAVRLVTEVCDGAGEPVVTAAAVLADAGEEAALEVVLRLRAHDLEPPARARLLAALAGCDATRYAELAGPWLTDAHPHEIVAVTDRCVELRRGDHATLLVHAAIRLHDRELRRFVLSALAASRLDAAAETLCEIAAEPMMDAVAEDLREALAGVRSPQVAAALETLARREPTPSEAAEDA